jgi:hypothetical protein
MRLHELQPCELRLQERSNGRVPVRADVRLRDALCVQRMRVLQPHQMS